MKCPNCGAEIENSKFCEYCGTQVTYEMQREYEQLNKQGCPKCGSSNIQFKRENHGEVYKKIHKKDTKKIIHITVGFCKDCGYTWYPNNENETSEKKNNMIWWILGWIFFFPAPIMVLIWRKKNTWDIKIKTVITVVFWLFFLVAGSSNNNANVDEIQVNEEIGDVTSVNREENITEYQSEITSSEIESAAEQLLTIDLKAGVQNDYSHELIFNAGTELENHYFGYFVPVGTDSVKNLGNYPTYVNVYTNEKHITEKGWEEPSGEYHNIPLEKGATGELYVGENQYVKIIEPAHIELTLIK